MNRPCRRSPGPPRPLLLAVLAAMAVLAPAAGAEVVLTGVLDGPTAGTDSPATGFATLVLDDAGIAVHYEITYQNLQGEEFAAHLHSGPEGNFGEIVHHLPLGTPKTGLWEPSARRVTELRAGQVSGMIHTDLHPEGELGGWVAVDGTPVRTSTWSAVKDLLRAE